jgi:hypothetical protein
MGTTGQEGGQLEGRKNIEGKGVMKRMNVWKKMSNVR